MGRHGRSAAPPAPEEAGNTGRHRAGTHPKKRFAAPVRTGLLGASAAVAVGAVAVASGLLPGGSQYNVGEGGTSGGQVSTAGIPELQEQGGVSAEPTDRASASPSRSSDRPQAPSTSPSSRPTRPPVTGSKTAKAPAQPSKTERTSEAPPSHAPAPAQTKERAAGPPAASSSAENAVLTLVNAERAKVGCDALRADASLGKLAQNFSDDMAARGFFDHTDPSGRTPWDRADAAGVKKLGGENIARGQADAKAVMDSWMNSAGHRANILNCDYTRLGVGVHTGAGGPWWTQDFGF